MLQGLIFKHQVSVSCKTYIGLLVNGKKGTLSFKIICFAPQSTAKEVDSMV